MKLRLTHTNRKDYKTRQLVDANGMPYLVWESFPEQTNLLTLTEKLGLRVWLAGTGLAEEWFLKEVHPAGSPFFAEGGYTVVSSYGEIAYILQEEAILHPTQTKKKKKKTNEQQRSNPRPKYSTRKR